MSVKPLNHYSFESIPSVFDEEALTALELAGRTAHKTNELVRAYNKLENETDKHLESQDQEIDERMGEAENYLRNNLPQTVNNLLQQFEAAGRLDGVLQSNYFATPQMYGAVADGVTDDTEAFKKALAENKRLFVPAGNYLVSTLEPKGCEVIGARGANIHVTGEIRYDGVYYPRIRNLVFTAAGESRDHLLYIKDSYYGVFEGVQIAGYSGAVNNGALLDGSNGNGVYYMHFRNCVFNNLPVGLKFYDFANANTVDNSFFYGCEVCIYNDGGENNRILSNTFQTYSVCGVRIDKTNKGVPKATNIMGNYFEGDVNSADTTFIGDIDMCNSDSVNGNFIQGNHYTYIKPRAHVVNMVSQNMVQDYFTNQETNNPNTFMGINAFQPVPTAYKVYGGEDFLGSLMPIIEDNGAVRYYIYGKEVDGRRGWQRVITTGLSESDTLTLPPVSTSALAQYYNGHVQIGYDYTGNADRALTFDTNQQLLKMYTTSNGGWTYYQKVESGTSDKRPTWKPRGYMYYDSTLGKPIWSNGSNAWVDATGASV